MVGIDLQVLKMLTRDRRLSTQIGLILGLTIDAISRINAALTVDPKINPIRRHVKGLRDLNARRKQSQTDADLPKSPGSAIKIQVDDFALDDIEESSLLSPDTEDGLDGSDSSPEEADLMPDPDILEPDLLEPEDELPFPRRHSWGPDPEDLGLKTKSNESQGENLGFSTLSKSMVHLDTDSGEELEPRSYGSRLSPHPATCRLSPHMDGRLSPRGMDGRLSPRHMMDTRISPLRMEPSRESKEKDDMGSPVTSPTLSPSQVTLADGEDLMESSQTDGEKQTSPTADDTDIIAILPPDNSGAPLATADQISAVPRRRKKTESLKEIRQQRSASMFEPRRLDFLFHSTRRIRPFSRRPLLPIHTQGSILEHDDDSDNDSQPSTPRSPQDVEELIRRVDTLPVNQKRQARLSLTEFLSDPRNFAEDSAEQQAVQSAVEGPSIGASTAAGEPMNTKKVFRRLSLFKGGSTRKSKEKREKDKDKEKGKHQYVPVSFSNSTKCDYCDKSMANKDALQCQVCLVNVHNSNSCKDNIPCTKLTKHPKQATKSASLAFRDKVGTKSTIGYSQSFKEKTRPSSTHGFHRPLTQTMSFQGSLQDLRLGQSNTRSLKTLNFYDTGRWHWHRVAVKLGVKTIEETEEAADDNVESPKSILTNNNLSASMESLEDISSDMFMVDDEDIVTRGPEPESWSVTVEKKMLKKMSHKDIKRQDVIFEFIMTEKHHVRTLKIMQKIFAYGMQHELHMDQSVISKVFPMLDHLVEIAVSFYEALKERQAAAVIVEKFGDLLVNQFSGTNGDNMLMAYGLLCSRQKEAVSVYKDLYKNDRKFQAFIKKCSSNALCRRWSIPECILSVSHRLTKYQLLIEAIMKPTKSTSAHKSDTPLLEKGLLLIKSICKEVDYQVEEYEKWQRLLEIYNKVEARSSGTLKSGKKFRKSDLLSSNRKLRHEGELLWKSARGKLTEIHAVLLTDVLIFLQENNQKFTFASQDNKPPVVHLHKLMVRDVAIDKRSIYLISPNKAGPEMYEVMCTSTSHRKRWKQLIETAVQECPDDDEGVVEDEIFEEKKAAEARAAKVKKLLEKMQEKDKQLNTIMEEKNKLMAELKETVTKEDLLGTLKSTVFKERDTKMQEARDVLLAAIQEAARLTSVVYSAGAGGLSRSASSAGERASSSYQSHALPKRAETFSGFDHAAGAGVKRRFAMENKLHGSSPNLPRLDNVDGGPGSPQGSNPNLASPDSPRMNMKIIPVTSPTISETSSKKDFDTQESVSSQDSTVRFAADSPTPLNQLPIQEDTNNYEQQHAQLYTREQIACANLLLQHLNALLSITTMKDTAYESMKTELLEANRKIETLSGSKKPHRTNSNRSTPTSPAPVIVTTPPPAKKSSPEKKQKEGSVKQNDKNNQEEPSNGNNIKVPQGELSTRAASEQNLRRIAFGDFGLTQDSPTHAGNGGTSLESPRSIMKRTGSDPPPRISHDSDSERNSSLSNRRQEGKVVPAHLLSATNEMQASSGLVRQKLPMKLSSLSSSSSAPVISSTSSNNTTSPVQQMLPKKLSSNSKSSSRSSSKLSRINSGSKKNNQNVQAGEQDVIYF
ncbi:uncharacterized protein [Amphiura filiformis]|uniref:uncharacterized protein n=1 Tax=Amphiura filiformis TaxID=82378 RepID=UPI003B21B302